MDTDSSVVRGWEEDGSGERGQWEKKGDLCNIVNNRDTSKKQFEKVCVYKGIYYLIFFKWKLLFAH